EIGLSVVEEEEIQSVNREHRSIDAVTDVLSFPMLEYDPQEAPALRVARAMAEGDVDPETDEVYLGDIMICLKRAKEQALEFGHSLQRELAFLAVHSLLHLLGYDHMTPEEEKVMFGKQEAVLQSIGLRRE
ncbi:MAG: rRNA maturation RNase YbeY, partial [Lachnospiraceae bacterium]|nr:rRNA maturation RNase YbeY [Lachnospiraceae bacterium]